MRNFKSINLSVSKQKISSRGGYSFAELMIASSIGMLLMMVILNVEVGAKRNLIISYGFNDLHSSARLVIDKISNDIRLAQATEPSYAFTGILPKSTTSSELVLKVPSIDSNGDVISSKWDYIAYFVDVSEPNKLKRIIQPDNASSRKTQINNQTNKTLVITPNLKTSGFSINTSTAGIIKVGVSVTKQSLDRQNIEEYLKAEIRFRNK